MQSQNTKIKIDTENLFHAYLLLCPDRETLDQIIDDLILDSGCLREDVTVIEPSDEKGKAGEIAVAEIRSFIHDLTLSSHGSMRIGIIHRAEKLNRSSANILLKTLEEPPKDVVIVLTASSSNIIPTIKSRCQIIRVNKEPESDEISFLLKDFLDNSLASAFKKIDETVKSNQTDKFLSDLTEQFETKMIENYDQKAANILEKIFRSQERIAGNANPRLTLENLIIFIRMNYKSKD